VDPIVSVSGGGGGVGVVVVVVLSLCACDGEKMVGWVVLTIPIKRSSRVSLHVTNLLLE
jgi:hypothetical protein